MLVILHFWESTYIIMGGSCKVIITEELFACTFMGMYVLKGDRSNSLHIIAWLSLSVMWEFGLVLFAFAPKHSILAFKACLLTSHCL